MNEDIQYCADQVRRGDPDRFLSAMTAPVADRAALFVLYAFNLEIVRAPWVTKEAMIAEMRLQWWLDAIDEIYSGKEPRRHQVVAPLAELIKRRDLPKELFDQLISARRWDVYAEPHSSPFAFEDYISASAGNLMVLSCLALGRAEIESVQNFGFGDGVARLFLAIPSLENAQKTPLIDGRSEAVARLAQLGLDRMSAVSFENKSIFPALRAAWMAKPILKRVIARPGCVAEGDLSQAEFSKKIRLLLKSFSNFY